MIYLPFVKRSEADADQIGLHFSKKEIEEMPYLKDGRHRIKPDGLHQIRYRRGGYNVQFTSKNKKEVEEKFRAWAKSVKDAEIRTPRKASGNFADFAQEWFEKVKRPAVEPNTYDGLLRSYQLHILPRFGELRLQNISAMMLQEFFGRYLEAGRGRTLETLRDLLGGIFRAAMGEGLIRSNPMSYVKLPQHERKKGTALSREEIRSFLEVCRGTPLESLFMIFLYTTAITLLGTKNDLLTRTFKKICPDHTLKDLRHTFISRCLKCKIQKELVDLWTDHVDKTDMTTAVYAHFSAEYQIEQMSLFCL